MMENFARWLILSNEKTTVKCDLMADYPERSSELLLRSIFCLLINSSMIRKNKVRDTIFNH